MLITLISGSTRAESQSRKVTNYLAQKLTNHGAKTAIIDLYETKLPLYDATDEGEWKSAWEQMQKTLATSDGFVWISPEWDGMMSVGIHNMLHYVEYEMADKPVLLVGVSSGAGGRYPLQQMRTMGYKNKRVVSIPESLLFDKVEEHLKDGAMLHEGMNKRAEYATRVLITYAEALQKVRASGVIDYETFPNGL